MTSRITQLVSRYVGAALLALAAMCGASDDPQITEAISTTAAAIGTLVAACVAFGIDLAVHKIGTGGFFTQPGEKAPPKTFKLPSDSRNFMILLVLLPAVMLSGCGATPKAQWAEQRAALTAAQDVIVELHKAGHLSDEDLIEASKIVISVRAYLTEALNHTEEPDVHKRLMGHVDAGLAALQQYILSTPAKEPDDGPGNPGVDRGADEDRPGVAGERADHQLQRRQDHRRATAGAAERGGGQRFQIRRVREQDSRSDERAQARLIAA